MAAPPSPKTYANVVEAPFDSKLDVSSIEIHDIPLPLRQAHFKNSMPAVLFSQIELQRSETPLQNSLIAKFSKGRPKTEQIREHISKNWGLKHTPIVGMIDQRHIYIQLFDSDDYNRAWTRNSHEMEGALFRLFKWTMDFSLTKESSIAPVWVKLPLLPLNFCVLSYLKAITQPLGKFLAADIPTLTRARPAYARVCVEVDLAVPLADRIWIGPTLDAGFWQSVVYERFPKYCTCCCLQGHAEVECRKGYVAQRFTPDYYQPKMAIPAQNMTTDSAVNTKKIDKPKIAQAQVASKKVPIQVYVPKVPVPNSTNPVSQVVQAKTVTDIPPPQPEPENLDKSKVDVDQTASKGKEKMNEQQKGVETNNFSTVCVAPWSASKVPGNQASSLNLPPQSNQSTPKTIVSSLPPVVSMMKSAHQQGVPLHNSFSKLATEKFVVDKDDANGDKLDSSSNMSTSSNTEPEKLDVVASQKLNKATDFVEPKSKSGNVVPGKVVANANDVVLQNSFTSLKNSTVEGNLDDGIPEKSSKKKKKKRKKKKANNTVELSNSPCDSYPSQHSIVCNNTIGNLMKGLHLDSSTLVREDNSDFGYDVNSDPDTLTSEKMLRGKYKEIKPFNMTTRGHRVRVKFFKPKLCQWISPLGSVMKYLLLWYALAKTLRQVAVGGAQDLHMRFALSYYFGLFLSPVWL